MGGRSKFLLFCFESGWRREEAGCRLPRAALGGFSGDQLWAEGLGAEGPFRRRRPRLCLVRKLPEAPRPAAAAGWTLSPVSFLPARCPFLLPAPPRQNCSAATPGPSARLAFTGSSSSCQAVPAWDTSSLLPPVSPPSPAQETRAAASNPRHRVCVWGGRCSRPPGRSPSSTMRTEQACPKDSPRACLQESPLPGRQTARGPRSETDACSLLGLPAGLRFFLRA